MLPQIGVQAGQSPQLVLLNVVAGCSGLLDIKNGLGLFSRSTSDTGAIAQCQQSAAATILQSEKGDPMVRFHYFFIVSALLNELNARSSTTSLAQKS